MRQEEGLGPTVEDVKEASDLTLSAVLGTMVIQNLHSYIEALVLMMRTLVTTTRGGGFSVAPRPGYVAVVGVKRFTDEQLLARSTKFSELIAHAYRSSTSDPSNDGYVFLSPVSDEEWRMRK